MKYILLMYNTEGVFTDEDLPSAREYSVRICHELHAKGQYIDASPLQPVATAISVRVRDGERSVTDGPFAETKEQLGGYILIDAPNLDEAIAVAARFPAALRGTVEIRPLFELANLPRSAV